MADASADLDGTLDRLVGRLTRPGAPKEAKALLLDARRLRTLVGNWRTIAPTEEARKEMSLRVEQLARSVDAVLPADAAPARTSSVPDRGSSVPPRTSSLPGRGPDAAPARASSLPGRAVVEEVRPGAIAEPYARRPLQGRPMSEPPPRAPSPSPAARPRSEEPPPRAPSPSPAARPRSEEPPPRVPSPSPAARPRSEPPPRPAAPALATHEWDEPPSLVVPARSVAPAFDEPTRAAPITTAAQADEERVAAARTAKDPARPNGEPIRPRTLPDLDISGLAQLLEDGTPLGFDDPTLDTNRPTVARSPRGDFDGVARRPNSDPPPPNGRRRGEAANIVDPNKGRVSRILIDPDNELGANGAQVVPSGSDDAAGRASPRPSRPSSSPPAARTEKTLIAVRPLPAPEVLDKRLVMLTEPFSPRADAYRALRRKLTGPGAPRTIAVTSAQSDEGKTSCAVNLALAFRETSSEKVLLLEANLKAPALAKLFGFEPPVCFAKQMAKNRDSTRASWTVAEQFEPLHVLAVDPGSKTSPLLDPVAFANALEQLVDAGYDHIIVDTPPALGGSDVNLIADAVDGIVVAAWIKKSKRSLVKKAIDQLKPATILGVVTLEG